jgi:hypothetical protein
MDRDLAEDASAGLIEEHVDALFDLESSGWEQLPLYLESFDLVGLG